MIVTSDTFFDAFVHKASVCLKCSCGRTFFQGYDEDCYEKGELEDLREKRRQDPAQYVEVDASMITAVVIDNKVFVYHCPCNGLALYEAFTWRYRRSILIYIQKRYEEQLETVTSLGRLLESTEKAIFAAEKTHVPELPQTKPTNSQLK